MEQTVLELLDDERIFSVVRNKETGGLIFIEECDRYFRLELTKKQVETLIKELNHLLSTPVSEKDSVEEGTV